MSPEAELARHSPLSDIFRRVTRIGPHLALAAGSPPNDALPLERWHECFDHVLTQQGTAALQYGMPNVALKEWVVEWMKARGLDCRLEHIYITNGNQHGLQLASRLLLGPGQRSLLERPTYTGILDVSQKRGIEVREVALRPEVGLDLAAWRAICESEHRPAAAFTIVDFHNPTGIRADGQTRAQLARIARETGVPIIEDDAYSALRISGEPLPPLRAYPGGEAAIYLGTFSKMLFPSLRLGWIVAPPELMPMLNGLRQTIDLQSSAMMAAVAAEFLRRGGWRNICYGCAIYCGSVWRRSWKACTRLLARMPPGRNRRAGSSSGCACQKRWTRTRDSMRCSRRGSVIYRAIIFTPMA